MRCKLGGGKNWGEEKEEGKERGREGEKRKGRGGRGKGIPKQVEKHCYRFLRHITALNTFLLVEVRSTHFTDKKRLQA